MHIVALEFTADGPELEHSEIDRMIDELEREFVCRENRRPDKALLADRLAPDER
jgi:hypothetical protein